MKLLKGTPVPSNRRGRRAPDAAPAGLSSAAMVNWMDVRGGGPRAAGMEGRDADPAARPALQRTLAGLNEPQRRAVLFPSGPLLILAGPGSGKTRVVTTRLAHLVLERGEAPESLLAITFTNRAAREMRERVEALIGPSRAWISTFHAACARILRREIEVLGGYTRDFSIFDTSDRNQLLKRLIRDAGYDATRFKPSAVGAWISAWKNGRAGFELDDEPGGLEEEVVRGVRRAYEAALAASNALDFDDLLLKVLELFERHPGVRDAYAYRFRHVMVDEYQDTNRIQYGLVRHLASAHGNLAVVGDPDQSIYTWRGADLRNILDFEQDFGQATVVRLEQNYRSSATILRAADAVIRHNAARKAKDLWTEREPGEPVCVLECDDEEDEAQRIADAIPALVEGGIPLGEIAVFYRANFLQRALESRLRLSGVPYQVVGGVEFYQRREIKDLISYLRLLVNPADEAAFRRVANVPRRGVGDKSVEQMLSWAADRRVSVRDALRSPEALAGVRGRGRKALEEFAALLDALGEHAESPAAVALAAVIESIDYPGWLAQQDDDPGVDREANVDELLAHAEQYDREQPQGGLRGFLEDVALVSEVDDLEQGDERVTLMTLHAAKGLEFRAVFIAGCEEELLPHFRALAEGDSEQGLEEERRLFYVGMTRARERLFLSHAAHRMHFGQGSSRVPSRFLDELPEDAIQGHEQPGAEPDLGAFEAAPRSTYAALRVGDRVRHGQFGNGTVETLQGSGINARATVHFPRLGTKTLLLEYARLEVLR